jgi:hypothetical protein
MANTNQPLGTKSAHPLKPNNIFTLLIIAALLILSVPWLQDSFAPTVDPLDSSWQWMLGYGVQHHMQWGPSIIFTYGPLGFLAAHPYFFSDHTLWVLCAIIAALTWVAFGLIYSSTWFAFHWNRQSHISKLIPICLAWLVGASLINVSTQSTFIAILLLVYAIQHGASKFAISSTILSGALLAFGSLIKSTELIVTLFVIIVYPVLWLYVYRSHKIIIAFLCMSSFFVFFTLFYLGSGQHIASLTQYIMGTFEIAGGYTSAMSTHGESLQTLAALLILLLFVVTGIRLVAQGNRLVVAQLFLFGVLLFMAWKEGFTRHDPGFGDGHAMSFYGIALLVSAVMIPILTNSTASNGAASISGAYLIALIFALPGLSIFTVNEIANYQALYNLMTKPSARKVLQKSQDKSIRNQFHLRRAALELVQGYSVNIVPWNLMMAQGYHMDLLPSPIFQTYSVYTSYLDHVNADQIWRRRGAQRIIYSFQSIDGRYPAFDEPATFRAMLTCYHTTYAGLRYTVMDRRQCVEPKLLRIGVSTRQRFGAWINVPSNADYMDIDVHKTVFGHLTDIFYKPNQVHVTFRLADGAIMGPYRFIYSAGGDGLFVKYFINDQVDANRLFSDNATGLKKISAMRLTTVRRSLDYGDKFKATFLDTKPRRVWQIRRLLSVALTPPGLLASSIVHNSQYRKAWDELSSIYFTRPDLQKAFPVRSVNFYTELLHWAAFTTPSSDQAYSSLRPFLTVYRAMLDRVRVSNVALTPPTLLTALINRNSSYGQAWDALSSVYLARPDLQKAFPLNSLASYSGLLRWASVGVPSSDPAFSHLRLFRADYKAMLVDVNKHGA